MAIIAMASGLHSSWSASNNRAGQVLQLQGSLRAAPNLTAYNNSHTERFAAMIQLQHVSFAAVIGGSNNAIRGVRAMSNNSDSIIGVNQSPHAEVGGCEVGGVSCHDIAVVWVASFSRWQRYRC